MRHDMKNVTKQRSELLRPTPLGLTPSLREEQSFHDDLERACLPRTRHDRTLQDVRERQVGGSDSIIIPVPNRSTNTAEKPRPLMPVDPVCGMEASTVDGGLTAEHDGATYYFCSRDCKALFEDDPTAYIETPHPHLSEIEGVTVPRLPYGRAKGDFEISVQETGVLNVGDWVTFTKTITEEDVRRFAEATSDTNAVHLNETFAEKTRFGNRIVHGTLVSGMISAALACLPGLSIYLTQNLEFRRPVSIGETLTAMCEIVEELEGGRYRLTTRLENETEELVIHGTATVLIDPLPE